MDEPRYPDVRAQAVLLRARLDSRRFIHQAVDTLRFEKSCDRKLAEIGPATAADCGKASDATMVRCRRPAIFSRRAAAFCRPSSILPQADTNASRVATVRQFNESGTRKKFRGVAEFRSGNTGDDAGCRNAGQLTAPANPRKLADLRPPAVADWRPFSASLIGDEDALRRARVRRHLTGRRCTLERLPRRR